MKEQPTTELLDILNNINKKDMSAYIKEFAATASAAAPFPNTSPNMALPLLTLCIAAVVYYPNLMYMTF